MAKPTDLPIWNTAEERVLSPDVTRQTTGWVWSGTKFEKPKGEHFNWWMNNVYKWTAHLDEVVGDGSAKLWQKKATTINVTADADITLTAEQNGYGRIIITDTGALLTTTRNIIVDTSERSFLFQNDTAKSLVVKTSAGTGIAVLAGRKVELLCDGTNVIDSVDVVTQAPSLLVEHEVTGAAVTSVDFSGLDISAHKSYRIELEIINPNGSTSFIYAFVNGDTTLANYTSEIFTASTTSVTSSRTADSRALVVSPNTVATGDLTCKLSAGYPVFISNYTRAIGIGVTAEEIGMTKNATVMNITQLTFTSSVASSIGVGSKIRIYRGDV